MFTQQVTGNKPEGATSGDVNEQDGHDVSNVVDVCDKQPSACMFAYLPHM